MGEGINTKTKALTSYEKERLKIEQRATEEWNEMGRDKMRAELKAFQRQAFTGTICNNLSSLLNIIQLAFILLLIWRFTA